MDADLIIYIYLRNAFPSHMCWYLHSSVIFRLLDGSNSLLAPAWAVCQLPMASSSSCLRGWLEDFSQHWGGLAEWCAKKMQDIKKRENYQSCKGHESSKWLQRHITYYIQQNSLRWSSQFGMQEHLICALHTIQTFQEKMGHILLQGQQTPAQVQAPPSSSNVAPSGHVGSGCTKRRRDSSSRLMPKGHRPLNIAHLSVATT